MAAEGTFGICPETRILGDYIKKEGSLVFHGGDPAYADWDADYELYRKEFQG